MLAAGRNVLVSSAALIVAVLAAASVQGAFQFALPALSGRTFASTDVSTFVLIIAVGVVFFASGALVPRWLTKSAPLIWLLLPIVVIYLIALIGQPGVYHCNPMSVAGCWVVHAPFFVGAVAVLLGYAVFGRGETGPVRKDGTPYV